MRRLFLVCLCVLLSQLQPTSAQDDPFILPELVPITAENVGQIEQLTSLGYGDIMSMAWSDDGQWLAVGSSIGVWLYNGSNLDKPPRHIGEYRNSVYDIIFSPDSNLLVFTNGNDDVYFMDVATGTSRSESITHYGSHGLSFNPEGRYLAIAGSPYSYRPQIWNVPLSGPVVYLEGHTNYVNALSFSPDGTRLATVGDDGTIHMWDATSHEELYTITDTPLSQWQVQFSSDGTFFVTVGREALFIWDTDTGALIQQLPYIYNRGYPPVTFALIDNDTQLVTSIGVVWEIDPTTGLFVETGDAHFLAGESILAQPHSTHVALEIPGGIQIINLDTFEVEKTLYGYSDTIFAIQISPDGQWLASGGRDGVIQVWHIEQDTGAINFQYTLDAHNNRIMELNFTHDSRFLVSASYDSGGVQFRDISTGELHFTIPINQQIYSIDLNDDDSLLAVGVSSRLIVWEINLDNPETNRHSATPPGLSGDVEQVMFTPDNEHILWLPDFSWELQIYNLNERTSAPLSESIQAKHFSLDSDGSRLAIGWGNRLGGMVAIHDYNHLDYPELWNAEPTYSYLILDMGFSPDDSILYIQEYFGPILLFDAATGEPLNLLFSASVAWSSDRRFLALGENEGDVSIWGIPAAGE